MRATINHDVTLEPGDMGLALMAMVPYLNVADDGHGDLTMTFAKAFEAVLRNATIVGVPMRANKFVLRQLNAEPLARCWLKLVPGLGLATAAVGSLKVLSRIPQDGRQRLRRPRRR